ncbi:hypothetical protein MPSEU_000672000 [Mayamaea pseudoterrestris]|nr:hypothetical protein MPSEU_000672000 [Mayamaea pseudoterrestris]
MQSSIPAASSFDEVSDEVYEEEIVLEDDDAMYDDEDYSYTEATYESANDDAVDAYDYEEEMTVSSGNLSTQQQTAVTDRSASATAINSHRPTTAAPPPLQSAPPKSNAMEDLKRKLEALKLQKEILEIQAKLNAAKQQQTTAKSKKTVGSRTKANAATKQATTAADTQGASSVTPGKKQSHPLAETPLASNRSNRKTIDDFVGKKTSSNAHAINAPAAAFQQEHHQSKSSTKSVNSNATLTFPKTMSIVERSQLLAKRLHYEKADGSGDVANVNVGAVSTQQSTSHQPSTIAATHGRVNGTSAAAAHGGVDEGSTKRSPKTQKATVSGGNRAAPVASSPSPSSSKRRVVGSSNKRSPRGKRSPGSARSVVHNNHSPKTNSPRRRQGQGQSSSGTKPAAARSERIAAAGTFASLKLQLRPPPPDRTPSMQERAALLAMQMQAINPQLAAATNAVSSKTKINQQQSAVSLRSGARQSQSTLPSRTPLDESNASLSASGHSASEVSRGASEYYSQSEQPESSQSQAPSLHKPLVSDFDQDEPKRWKPPPPAAAPPVHARPNSMSDFAMEEPKRWKPPAKQQQQPEPTTTTNTNRHSEFAAFGQETAKRWKPPPKVEPSSAASSVRPNSMSDFAMDEPKRWKPPAKATEPTINSNRSDFADFANSGKDENDQPAKRWPTVTTDPGHIYHAAVDPSPASPLNAVGSTEIDLPHHKYSPQNAASECEVSTEEEEDTSALSPTESKTLPAVAAPPSKAMTASTRWLDDSSSSSSSGTDDSSSSDDEQIKTKKRRAHAAAFESYDSGNDSETESSSHDVGHTAEQEYAMALLARFAAKEKPKTDSNAIAGAKEAAHDWHSGLVVEKGRSAEVSSDGLSDEQESSSDDESGSDSSSCSEENASVLEVKPLLGDQDNDAVAATKFAFTKDSDQHTSDSSCDGSAVDEDDDHSASIESDDDLNPYSVLPAENVTLRANTVPLVEEPFTNQAQKVEATGPSPLVEHDPAKDADADTAVELTVNDVSESKVDFDNSSSQCSVTASSHNALLVKEQKENGLFLQSDSTSSNTDSPGELTGANNTSGASSPALTNNVVTGTEELASPTIAVLIAHEDSDESSQNCDNGVTPLRPEGLHLDEEMSGSFSHHGEQPEEESTNVQKVGSIANEMSNCNVAMESVETARDSSGLGLNENLLATHKVSNDQKTNNSHLDEESVSECCGESYSESCTDPDDQEDNCLTKEQEYAMALLSRVGVKTDLAIGNKSLEATKPVVSKSSASENGTIRSIATGTKGDVTADAVTSSLSGNIEFECHKVGLSSETPAKPHTTEASSILEADTLPDCESDVQAPITVTDGDKNQARGSWFSKLLKPVIGGSRDVPRGNELGKSLEPEPDNAGPLVDPPDDIVNIENIVDNHVPHASLNHQIEDESEQASALLAIVESPAETHDIIAESVGNRELDECVSDTTDRKTISKDALLNHIGDKTITENQALVPPESCAEPESRLEALRQRRNHQKAMVQASLDNIKFDTIPRREPLLSSGRSDAAGLVDESDRQSSMALAVLSYLKHMQLDKTAARFQKEWTELHGSLADKPHNIMGTLSWEPLLTTVGDESTSSSSDLEPEVEKTLTDEVVSEVAVGIDQSIMCQEAISATEDGANANESDICVETVATVDEQSIVELFTVKQSEVSTECTTTAVEDERLELSVVSNDTEAVKAKISISNVISPEQANAAAKTGSSPDDDGYFYDIENNPFFLDEEGTKVYVDEDGEPVYYLNAVGRKVYYDSDDERESNTIDLTANESTVDGSKPPCMERSNLSSETDEDGADTDESADEEESETEDMESESSSSENEESDSDEESGSADDPIPAVKKALSVSDDTAHHNAITMLVVGESADAQDDLTLNKQPIAASTDTPMVGESNVTGSPDERNVRRTVSFDNDVKTISTDRYEIESKIDLFYDRDDIKRFKAEEEARKQRKEQKKLSKALDATIGAATANMDSFWKKA